MPPTKTSPEKSFTIARLAHAAGVGVETVRYYQRRGLMPVPAAGGEGAFRHYDEHHLQRLLFVRRAQAAGFTLEEIGELLALDRGADRARVRALARARLDALAARQAELEAARVALERLLHECEDAKRGPCPIIEAFDPPPPGAKERRPA